MRTAISAGFGTEAHLVHAGAAVDVIGGARFHEIPSAVRARVLAVYPRLELKAFLADALRREHREHPSSRMGLLVSLGFLDQVRAAPYEE
jgi:hypothetical protein